MGVLRSAAHRRAESRFWGVFIFAVHRAFVLGLGARHRGIVDLSEGVIRCVTVFACYSSSSSSVQRARSRCAEFRTCYFPLDDLNSFFSRVLDIVPKEKKRSKRKGPL